jgi:hypothetical protein
MPKTRKPKIIKLTVRIEIEGSGGIDNFARMLRVLSDNGYSKYVNTLVKLFVTEAMRRGAAVPPEMKAMVEREEDPR